MAAIIPEPTWFEHVDFMQACLVTALGVIVFFALRTLNTIDSNQKLLFAEHDILRKDLSRLGNSFSELRGQHIAIHKIGNSHENT
jgi:hypothetical protein